MAHAATVVHGLAPVLGRGGHAALARLNGSLTSGEREVAARTAETIGNSCAEQRPNTAAASWHADKVAMDLVGGERVIKDVGVGDGLDDGTLQSSARGVRSVGAAPPCLRRRGRLA